MSHRRAPSGRSASRQSHTAFLHNDRRHPGNPVFIGCDRRKNNRRSTPRALTMPKPAPASANIPTKPRPPTLPEMPAFLPPTEAEIGQLAQHLFMESGQVTGRDVENWLEAEARLWLRATQASIELQRRIWEDYRLALEQDFLADPERYDERLWIRRISHNDPPW